MKRLNARLQVGVAAMRRFLTLAALAALIFASSAYSATSASSTCTAAQIANHQTPFDCAFAKLRWESLAATSHVDLSEFISVHVSLDDDLMSAFYTREEGLHPGGPNSYNDGSPERRAALHDAALRKMAEFDAHVVRLMKSGRVSDVDGKRVLTLSALVVREMRR